MLVSGMDILMKAHEGGYAVGAFNISNLEFTQAAISAAEEERSPIILQASQSAISYAGSEALAAIVKVLADKASVPVAFHLDHGTDWNVIMKCLRDGWTSVMFDGSKHSLDQNIELTNKVIEIARPMGVSVEAELGKISGVEDHIVVDSREAAMTDPQEAIEFVERTNIDFLAIAIGNAHGVYKGDPKLDFDRIKLIKEKVNIPLVLHGASGISENDLKKAISLGINKINIDTDLRQAFQKAMHKVVLETPDIYDPRKMLSPTTKAIKEVVRTKIRIFGSNGRA